MECWIFFKHTYILFNRVLTVATIPEANCIQIHVHIHMLARSHGLHVPTRTLLSFKLTRLDLYRTMWCFFVHLRFKRLSEYLVST
nr:hypothetical protein NNONMNKP_00072 [Oryctes rhinoceros nudivirus]